MSRVHRRPSDAAIAVGLGALAQAEVWFGTGTGHPVAVSLAAAVMCGALAWRRSAPLFATLAVFAAMGVLGTVEELPVAVFVLPVTLIALYSVAAYEDARARARGLLPR